MKTIEELKREKEEYVKFMYNEKKLYELWWVPRKSRFWFMGK